MITEGFVSDILASSEERYEIRVADELIDNAKNILEGAKNIVKSLQLAPRGFIVDIENDTSHLINEILVKAGIKVQALIPLESSLEETFIKLTEKNKANNTSVSVNKAEQPKEPEAVQKEDKEDKEAK